MSSTPKPGNLEEQAEKQFVQSVKIPKLVINLGRNLIILIVLGLAVHLLIPQITTLKSSLEVLRSMKLWAVSLAILAQVASYLGSGFAMKEIVALTKHRISIIRGVLVTLGSYSIGLVAGGMVGSIAATYRWVKNSGGGAEGATLAGALPYIFSDIVLMVVTILGLTHLLLIHSLTNGQLVTFAIILAAMLLIAATLLLVIKKREAATGLAISVSNRANRLLRKSTDSEGTKRTMNRLFAAWDILVSGGWKGPLLGNVMNIGFDMLTIYFLFLAAGYAVSPGVLLSGYGLPLIFSKIAFLLPGGLGVIEATMTALYNSLGVPVPVTVVVVLTYRVLSFWLPTLIGFPAFVYLQRVAGGQEDGSVA